MSILDTSCTSRNNNKFAFQVIVDRKETLKSLFVCCPENAINIGTTDD